MTQKVKKQCVLSTSTNFSVKVNTINPKSTECLFVDIKSWIKPQAEYDFEKLPSSINKKIKQDIFYKLKDAPFEKNFILDFDLRASGLRKDKLSFMKINLALFPKTPLPFLHDTYKETLNGIINDTIKILEDYDIKYYKNKKNGISG